MADEVATTVRSMVDKVLEADVPDQIARRGRDFAAAVTEATDAASTRAAEAWRDSAPARRDAEKTVRRAGRDAAVWSRRTWRGNVAPALRDAWKRRGLALGAAGAAIPAGREIAEDAAVRLGLRRRREQRHWTAFFIGLVLGAAAGAVVALLTTPKAGRQMRDDLTVRARETAERARETAREAAELARETARETAERARETAREAADSASDWVPLFQRPEGGADAPDVADEQAIGESPATAAALPDDAVPPPASETVTESASEPSEREELS